MSNNKAGKWGARAMETTWLVLSIICLAAGIYNTAVTGLKSSLIFFIFAMVAFGMFILRRNMRHKEPE